MKFTKQLMALAMIGAFFTFGGSVSAEGGAGFTVKAVTNDSTIDKNVGWFNFSVDGKAGEEITNHISLINLSNEEKTIQIRGYNGFSQTAGAQLTYKTDITDGGITDDKYEFLPNFKNTYDEITLAPNESKNVPFTITAPDFSGQLMGALAFSEKDKINETADAEKGESGMKVNIKNEYVVAVQMFGKESSMDEAYASKEPKAEVLGQMTHVTWNLENPNDIIAQQNIEYTLTKGNETIQEGVIENFKMAPKTFTMAKFIFEGELSEGSYNLTVNGTDMPFEISEELVERAKAKAPENAKITTEGFTTFQMIMMALGLLLVGLVLFFVMKKNNKKREKELEEKIRKEMTDKQPEQNDNE